MKREDMMPIEQDAAGMWRLSEDRTSVRLSLPPLPLEGLPRPLELFLDFDAEAVDDIIARLTELRARMEAE